LNDIFVFYENNFKNVAGPRRKQKSAAGTPPAGLKNLLSPNK
jgi:hypothetical protein